MKNIKIMPKLTGVLLLAGVVPLIISGMYVNKLATQSLMNTSYGHLKNIREIKKSQIETLFTTLDNDIKVLAQTTETLRESAFQKLKIVQELKKAQIEDFFTDIHNDILSLSKSEDVLILYKHLREYHDNMGFAPAESYDVNTPEYRQIYDRYSRYLINYTKNYGYQDMYLICKPHGHVMFTASKQNDMGTNLAHGEYKDESLSHLWQKVIQTEDVVFEDFSSYTPNSGKQAAFVGYPIYDEDGSCLGLIALQIPTAPINTIVQRHQGMGRTGETYLVGKENGKIAFRSDGKYFIGYETSMDYEKEALSGKQKEDIYTDSQGNLVIVAYAPLEIKGLNWACISKIDLEEAIVPKDEAEKDDFFTRYITMYGYYDLFLIHPQGGIFYTVKHEADYGTNILTSGYASDMGELVKQILETGKPGITDFKPYAPSNNDPAAFAAYPVLHNNATQLIVALQVSLDGINRIMQQRDGMGETGETYLVGSDRLMRSDSFLDPIYHSVKTSFDNPEKGSVDTEGVSLALSGKTGEQIITDYSGSHVLSAYTPLKIGDTSWVLMAEIDQDEVRSPIRKLISDTVIMGVIISVIILILAFFIAKQITNPIIRSVNFADAIRKGNFAERMQIESGDEIGTLGCALNEMAAGLEETYNRLEENAAALKTILSQVASVADQVTAGVYQISKAVQSVSEGTTEQAASLEQISSSMVEIGSQTRANAENASQADQLVTHTRELANHGMDEMKKMIAAMNDIDKAGKSVTGVIKIIDDISFQTNLLALNAAVEAVRAGRYGKGFTVVADEVRRLAGQCSVAAGETSDLIQTAVKKVKIGNDIAHQTAEVLQNILKSVIHAANLVSDIAVSSEEQAQAIDQSNQGLMQIEQVVHQNTVNAEETASAAEELSEQASQLRQLFEMKKDE